MRPILFVLTLLVFYSSCSKDAELLKDANIEDIQLSSSNVEGLNIRGILKDTDKQIVYLMPDMATPDNLDSLVIYASFELSKGAKINPSETEPMVFYSANDVLTYTVTAQNGDAFTWYIRYVGNQLPNSNFETWHECTGLDGTTTFKEPGSDDITNIWSSVNLATSAYDIYGCTRFYENSSEQIKLKTSATETIPITWAAVFTGSINSEYAVKYATHLEDAIELGTPFALRPDTLSIWYRYEAGDELIQATPIYADSIEGGFTTTAIDGYDKFQIYAVLNQGTGSDAIEIGRAELTSSIYKSRLIQVKIPFTYSLDLYPTSIIFFATSSIDGAEFSGAVESTLVIDNFSFIYN